MPSPTRVLITFCVGIAATLAWQSYGGAARQIIASSYPQLGWLAPQAAQIAHTAPDMIALAAPGAPSPDQQRLNAMSLDLNAVRHNVDRIASTQEQITRSVDQLTAGHERMTREITKLQAVEQQILHKTSEPPPRPVPTSAHKPVPRSSQAPTGLTPARNP
jgi:hypothetical protein